jgi:ABC-type phosphate transport system substrate-binding protein
MAFKQYIYHLIFPLLFILLSREKLISQTQNNSNNYIVIGNAIGVQKLTSKNLKEIFYGEKTFWANKNKITLTVPSSKNPLCSSISKNIYNMSVMGMQKYWLSLTFQGSITPPVFLENDDETIKFVESNPGAIGFILETNSNKTKAEKIVIEN